MYALEGTIEKILEAKGIFPGTSVSMKLPCLILQKQLCMIKKVIKLLV